jgi:hypothetical protein
MAILSGGGPWTSALMGSSCVRCENFACQLFECQAGFDPIRSGERFISPFGYFQPPATPATYDRCCPNFGHAVRDGTQRLKEIIMCDKGFRGLKQEFGRKSAETRRKILMTALSLL